MVVDNETIIADTLALILNMNGYETVIAYSGEEAVELAKESKPDILITDVIMGALNGIDSAIRIRQDLPGCRVILISGQLATAGLLVNAGEAIRDFEILAKPVHPRAILDSLLLQD